MYEVIKKGRYIDLSISSQFDIFDKLVKPVYFMAVEFGIMIY